MFYIINYENGAQRHGEFRNYDEAVDYAENNNGGHVFTIEEYDSEDEYLENT